MPEHSIRKKLTALVLTAVVPLLALNIVILGFMSRFQKSYDEILTNMTVANSYNLNFKEEMDECIYKLVFNGERFGKPDEKNMDLISQPNRKNPYVLIYELREDFAILAEITTDTDSANWLRSLLRNIDTLEDRVDDIRLNLDEGGHYTENIEMLDNNIYILTELINDDIQYYLYYQTRSMEQVHGSLQYSIRFFRLGTALLLFVLIGVVTAGTVLILRKITGPLGELTRVTRRISQGDFSARSAVATKDEIGMVAGSVNDMAEHLEIMVSQIKEDERRMRDAELRLLQEQINPHFLYNTLDAIVWLIEGGKNEEAEDMIISLSDFFKLALSNGKDMITIRDEERHIRSYLQIQQVRYRDILSYEIAIDRSVYQYGIMKLTLQPLVENAIYHGIKPKRSPGKITITGGMNENRTITLTVEDDGAGMTPEELARVRKAVEQPGTEEERDGFGMANVAERIRLNFGKEYGITIKTEPGRGTKVSVTIPARWTGESGVTAENGGMTR